MLTAVTAFTSLQEIEPDLELESWTVPVLWTVVDDGPRCPACGGRLVFARFHRIRPPPLHLGERIPA